MPGVLVAAAVRLILLLIPAEAQHEVSTHPLIPAVPIHARVPRGYARRLRVSSGDTLVHVQHNSMLIIGSMVDAFLAEQGLSKDDKACLVKGTEEFTDKIMTVVTHVVMLIQQITGQRDDMPGLVESEIVLPDFNFTLRASDSQEAPATAAPTTMLVTTTQQSQEAASMDVFFGGQRRLDLVKSSELLMHVSAVFMEIGYSLQLLVKLSNQITRQCINGKTLAALETAAKNAHNVKYVAGHFLANGADVIKEMADSVIAYKAEDFERFGRDTGSALRKIFLSNDTNTSLPSGKPGKFMMVNMSMGFVKGFFGKGFTLEIQLKQDPDKPLRVNLEECIANNLPFFEEIFSAVTFAVARKETAATSEDEDSEEAEQKKKQGRAEVGTALAVAVLQMPDALKRCGLGADQADMLMDSIRAFGDGMHLTLSTPNKIGSTREITKSVGRTVEDWHNMDWYQFGYDLGHLLQSLVLSLFERKYCLTEGTLRHQQLVELGGAMGSAGHLERCSSAVLGLGTLLVTMGLVLARWRQRCHAVRQNHEHQLVGVGCPADTETEDFGWYLASKSASGHLMEPVE